jgi:hypothetical protein
MWAKSEPKMAPNGRRCSELMGKRWWLIEPIPLGAGNGGVAKKFQRSDQVNALSRLTDFQSIAPGPKAKNPPWFAFRRSSWSANFSWVWSPTPGFSATTLRTSPYATAA